MSMPLLNFRLPPKTLLAVRQEAAKNKMTVSEWVRFLIEIYLEADETPAPAPVKSSPGARA